MGYPRYRRYGGIVLLLVYRAYVASLDLESPVLIQRLSAKRTLADGKVNDDFNLMDTFVCD